MPKKISDNCLTDLLDEGFNQAEIARACNMSRQGINQMITYTSKRNEIKLRQYTVIYLRRLGFLMSEIMDFTGYSRGNVTKLMVLSGFRGGERPYGPREHTLLKRFKIIFLFLIGFSVPDIAELSNYSINTVKNNLYKEGYSLKGRDSTKFYVDGVLLD